jgi:transcriptional regulator of aromatic amino acid metabolism
MRYEYIFKWTLDPAAIVSPIKEVVDKVNVTMEKFGFTEKMGLRSQCLDCKVTTGVELNDAQIDLIKNTYLIVCNKNFPDWKVEFDSYERVPIVEDCE